MLEQETEDLSDGFIDEASYRMSLLYEQEMAIDVSLPVYLITWSPDPAELPDSDVHYQNAFNVNLLADFLTNCLCGAFCMELNQQGNVHYHGWYQIDDDKILKRIVCLKVMRKFGPQLRIKKCRSYKVFSFIERCNGLYYYKKELMSYVNIKNAVITSFSKDDTNWGSIDMMFFFTKGSKTVNVIDKVSDRKYYMQFYTQST